jgi:hypothetical protein
MIDGSSFLGLFTLELIGQAFFRSAGKGIRISLLASPVNQASCCSSAKITRRIFARAEPDCFDNGLSRSYAAGDSWPVYRSACTFRTTCEG